MARYATTDLHGCLLTFQRLVEDKLQLTRHDELYVLGDYVNKGPNSRDVIDYLQQLQADDYHVVCLRGNHDQELLDVARGTTAQDWAPKSDLHMTLQSFGVRAATAIPPE